MSTETKLRVTEIQRFCMHDGPGIRTTVFLKGCPLRCVWCHNPETQKRDAELLFYSNKCIGCGSCADICPGGAHTIAFEHRVDRTKCAVCAACAQVCPTKALEICGTERTDEEILAIVEKDSAFYGAHGGITLSGGEPFTQNAAVALLKACKERGLHTAVETCGYADIAILRETAPFVDLFLWDIKDTNDARHKKYTSVSNKKILDNLSAVNATGARIRLRCILANGINTDEAHYRGIAEIASSLSNCEGVEFLPYHAYGGTKAVFLGGEDTGRTDWIPEAEQLTQARIILQSRNVHVF